MDIVKAGPTGAGGSFEIAPDVLASQLKEWEALQGQLEGDAERARNLAETRPSGNEAASMTVANLARRSGEEFLRHNTAMLEFVAGHIRALTAARDTYVNGEENARHHLGRHG